MSRGVRLVVFGLGAVVVAALFGFALVGMPDFGAHHHPYRDLAVSAALARHTPNVVSSVNFDLRPMDTLGEETILLGSVVGAAALLRPSRKERERASTPESAPVLDATTLLGYVLLPITLALGLDLVVHGHLSPGGGFQGGVVLATGLHLLYLAGWYPALRRLRPMGAFELGEGVGALAFALIGVAGLAAGGAFLANVVPLGSFRQLLSAGTVPLLNVAVGMEVGCGCVVLLGQFLAVAVRYAGGRTAKEE